MAGLSPGHFVWGGAVDGLIEIDVVSLLTVITTLANELMGAPAKMDAEP